MKAGDSVSYQNKNLNAEPEIVGDVVFGKAFNEDYARVSFMPESMVAIP